MSVAAERQMLAIGGLTGRFGAKRTTGIEEV
jgi:hypothetical protein